MVSEGRIRLLNWFINTRKDGGGMFCGEEMKDHRNYDFAILPSRRRFVYFVLPEYHDVVRFVRLRACVSPSLGYPSG